MPSPKLTIPVAAIHEASHAALAVLLGIPFDKVELRFDVDGALVGGGLDYGHHHQGLFEQSRATPSVAKYWLVVIVGGEVGHRNLARQHNDAWSAADRVDAHKLVLPLLAPFIDHADDAPDPFDQDRLGEAWLLEVARERAKEMLAENEDAVRRLAKALELRHSLSHQGILDLLDI